MVDTFWNTITSTQQPAELVALRETVGQPSHERNWCSNLKLKMMDSRRAHNRLRTNREKWTLTLLTFEVLWVISQGRIVTKYHGVTVNIYIEFKEIPQVQIFLVLGDLVIVRTKRQCGQTRRRTVSVKSIRTPVIFLKEWTALMCVLE